MKTKYIVLLGILGLLLVGFVSYFINAERNRVPVEVADVGASTAEKQPVEPSGESIRVGGVNRPASDFSAASGKAAGPARLDDAPDYGQTAPIAADANPQVAAVVKAVLEKNRPELLSPVIAPLKFDPVAYAKSPNDYLGSPEPGRVFAPAQPGEGVKEIRRKGDSYVPVVQGESVKLVVESEPDSPVTFTSFDLGYFQNQLTTVTVAADANGLATAEFFAARGTFNQVNILAASPVTSGQVKFLVDISLPATEQNQ